MYIYVYIYDIYNIYIYIIYIYIKFCGCYFFAYLFFAFTFFAYLKHFWFPFAFRVHQPQFLNSKRPLRGGEEADHFKTFFLQ